MFYPTPKKKRLPAMQPFALSKETTTETVGTIYGKTPGSVEEWRVAVALWKYKLPFEYQVNIRGGSRLRGGQRVDFVVSNPFPQPVQVYGEYWHTGQLGSEDRMKLAILADIYGREVVVLWGSELGDQSAADAAVRRELL